MTSPALPDPAGITYRSSRDRLHILWKTAWAVLARRGAR